jgi:hypothetical protein
MEVRLTKEQRRNQLTCLRADGSQSTASLGPSLPHHDLAHFVVEKRFGLQRGFFGNIAAGYSIEALSDKEVIKTLGAESWIAEILARAVGSLATGACSAEQFPILVNDELHHMGIARIDDLTAETAKELLAEFSDLVRQYASLHNGASLVLQFD